MARTKRPTTVSVFNWMLTIILMLIPGVNALFVLLTLIFAKTPSKRNFAWAHLILTALVMVAIVTLLVLFPEEAAQLAEYLRTYAVAG